MGFFEALFYTIWRGFAIGILISAPMGPVGILCIQRTLDKGRRPGLYTGVGAAISDLFYCILTGFGLSFIEEFLERNQNIIQLVGSVVLIAFAVYLFKKNPASSLKTPEQEAAQISPHKNILGGFLFTFSNPLILFLIIGLFARFNFSIPEISFYYYIAGYVAIFCGAILWWQFVTFTVNKLRAHFNLRSMWLINKIIGGIILIFAIVGIVTGITNMASAQTMHWNQGRGYAPFAYATTEGILIDNSTDTLKYDYHKLTEPTEEFTLGFRARNLHGHPSKKYTYKDKAGKEYSLSNPQWGFFLTCEEDTVVIEVRGREKITVAEPGRTLEVTLYSHSGNETPVEPAGLRKREQVNLVGGMDPYTGDNLWNAGIEGGRLKIGCGNHEIREIASLEVDSPVTGFGFFAGWGDKVLISDINIEFTETPETVVEDFPEQADLDAYLATSEDEMEGYWTLFDRELEESLLKLGGTYLLACLNRGDEYVMYYLEGAQTNSKKWERGDRKATLRPTPFEGIYEVTWFDSMKEPMSKDIKAQQGDGNTLTIQFPYQSSKIRLRKM